MEDDMGDKIIFQNYEELYIIILLLLKK